MDHIVPLELLDGAIPIGISILVSIGGEEHAGRDTIVVTVVEVLHLISKRPGACEPLGRPTIIDHSPIQGSQPSLKIASSRILLEYALDIVRITVASSHAIEDSTFEWWQ